MLHLERKCTLIVKWQLITTTELKRHLVVNRKVKKAKNQGKNPESMIIVKKCKAFCAKHHPPFFLESAGLVAQRDFQAGVIS